MALFERAFGEQEQLQLVAGDAVVARTKIKSANASGRGL
jgi:hypothetical protein